MKRIAIGVLVAAVSFGIAVAQDPPLIDKPADPKVTEKSDAKSPAKADPKVTQKSKDAGCGEMTGCCGEARGSKDKKASKSKGSAQKTAVKSVKPVKAN
jgi:hypothetical protein